MRAISAGSARGQRESGSATNTIQRKFEYPSTRRSYPYTGPRPLARFREYEKVM